MVTVKYYERIKAMKNMTSAELRQAFLEYFQSQGHQIVDSSSLIPANDPTLMFTNAGMVQFKDVFLGDDKRSYNRGDYQPALRTCWW